MGYGEELSKSSSYCHLPHLFPPAHQESLPEAQGSRSGKPTNNLWWKLEKETNVLIQRIFEMISSEGKLSQLKCQAFKIPKQKTDAMCVQFKTGLGITLLKLSEDTFKRCNSDQNFGEGFSNRQASIIYTFGYPTACACTECNKYDCYMALEFPQTF